MNIFIHTAQRSASIQATGSDVSIAYSAIWLVLHSWLQRNKSVQRFSKFLQLPGATASTVWANQRAEFKSFCNLIGWHGSRPCNRMLQELGKALYRGLQVPCQQKRCCNSTLTNYNYHKWHHLNSDSTSSDFQVLFADKGLAKTTVEAWFQTLPARARVWLRQTTFLLGLLLYSVR